eukprot:9783154-Ditylum_brightwellii.AAC.1
MQYVLTSNCRFCNHPMGTIEHLIRDCAGTQSYCINHELSFATMVSDNPATMKAMSSDRDEEEKV